MRPQEPIGLYVDDLWVTIAPEELTDGSQADIDHFAAKLVGPHEINMAVFENAQLEGPDELRNPFNWEYDPAIGDKML